jgi:hypothetical protein
MRGLAVVALVAVPSLLAIGLSAGLAVKGWSRPVSVAAQVAQFASVGVVLACPTVAVVETLFVQGGA